MKTFLFVALIATTLLVVTTAKKPKTNNHGDHKDKIISYEQNMTCSHKNSNKGKNGNHKITAEKMCKCVDPGWQRCMSKAHNGTHMDNHNHYMTNNQAMSSSTGAPAMAAPVMTDAAPVMAAVMSTNAPDSAAAQ